MTHTCLYNIWKIALGCLLCSSFMYSLENESRKSQTPHDITYMWNAKYDTNEHIEETDTDSQTQRTDWLLPRGLWVEEGWIGNLELVEANHDIGNG